MKNLAYKIKILTFFNLNFLAPKWCHFPDKNIPGIMLEHAHLVQNDISGIRGSEPVMVEQQRLTKCRDVWTAVVGGKGGPYRRLLTLK